MRTLEREPEPEPEAQTPSTGGAIARLMAMPLLTPHDKFETPSVAHAAVDTAPGSTPGATAAEAASDAAPKRKAAAAGQRRGGGAQLPPGHPGGKAGRAGRARGRAKGRGKARPEGAAKEEGRGGGKEQVNSVAAAIAGEFRAAECSLKRFRTAELRSELL
jgi:hypothetical protein